MAKTPEKIETRQLYVDLSPADIGLRSNELATAERILGEVEAKEAAATERWKAEKKALETDVSTARAKLSMLGRIVREKRELRDVEVKTVFDFENRVVDTVRQDTGEIIETRGMTQSEMQRKLFDVTPKALPGDIGNAANA